MTKDELVKLAALCEAASGPDRELDLEIACIKFNKPREHFLTDELDRLEFGHQRDYTSSLDSAMTLVPEGWALDCLKEGEVGSWYINLRPRYWIGEWQYSKAATPALALCAAALRATATGEAK